MQRPLLRFALVSALLAAPVAAHAAGGGSNTPPKPSPTTTTCKDGMVFSTQLGACVRVQSEVLDDDVLYGAVREFAYAGQYDDARTALAEMSDQSDDRVLTYLGFINRKTGDAELGNAYYRQAIAANPNNLLARSYMGQGFVEAGDFVAARAELLEIRARGGKGTWPEVALAKAISSGTTYDY